MKLFGFLVIWSCLSLSCFGREVNKTLSLVCNDHSNCNDCLAARCSWSWTNDTCSSLKGKLPGLFCTEVEIHRVSANKTDNVSGTASETITPISPSSSTPNTPTSEDLEQPTTNSGLVSEEHIVINKSLDLPPIYYTIFGVVGGIVLLYITIFYGIKITRDFRTQLSNFSFN